MPSSGPTPNSETAEPAPEQTLTSYYVVPDVEAFLVFLEQAFGAVVTERMEGKEGQVMHAEVRIGNSGLMMGRGGADQAKQACIQYVYVDDVDAAYQKLLAAGATAVQEPEDQFYGHRTAAGRDPFENQWWLAQRKEDLSPEELQKRASEYR